MKKKIIPLIIIVSIFAFNLFLIWNIFSGTYSAQMGSIESVFLTNAKFIIDNFPHISWYPFWYMGFPFHLTYQPVVPFLLAFGHFISGLEIAKLYRIFAGFFYALAGVNLYLLVRYLTKKELPAIIAAIIFSAVPSIGYLISEVYGMGQVFGFVPWRWVVLTIYGEGPHIWGLALVPLAILFTLRLLREGKKIDWLWAILTSLWILLTSMTAFLGLMIFLIIILIAEAVREKSSEKLFIFILLIIFILGLAAFWYDWSFIKVSFLFVSNDGGGIGISSPVLTIFIMAPLLVVLISFLTPKIKKNLQNQLWFMAWGIFLTFFISIYLWYNWRIGFLPIPFRSIPRFIPELEMAFSILIAVILNWIANKLKIYKKQLGPIFLIIIIGFLTFWAINKKSAFDEISIANTKIEKTSEYQIAKWLSENANQQRTYLTGTHAFWLNYWADVPQIRGGKGGDFGGLNPWWSHLVYQIYYGQDGELATNWLKALGMKYIVVNSGTSQVTYHDFQYPQKFEGILKKLYEYQGDIIYQIPINHTGLAQTVNLNLLEQVPKDPFPKEGKVTLDENRLEKYLAAVENDNNIEDLNYQYPVSSWDKMTIEINNLKLDNILVRISFDKGWRAYQNGKKIKIERDPIGFMVLKPISKTETIDLKYHHTLDYWLGYLISLITIGLLIIFLRSKRPDQIAEELKKPSPKPSLYKKDLWQRK